MAIFQSGFFTLKGQKERLSNVVQTLKAAVTGKGVQANTKSPAVNKVLSSAASNPYTTAAVLAVGAKPKAAASMVKGAYSSLSGTGKAVAVGGGIAAASAAVSNPAIVSKAAQLPKNISSFSSNVSTFASNPSVAGAKNVFQENPYITTAVAAGTAFIVGKGVTSAVTSLANTSAIRQQTETIRESGINSVVNPVNTKDAYKQAQLESKTALELARINAENQYKIAALSTPSPNTQIAQPITTSTAAVTPIAAAPAAKKKRKYKKKAKKKPKKKKKATPKKKKKPSKKKKSVKYKKKSAKKKRKR